MANQLDEMNPEFMEEGREVDVIVKQIPVTVTEQERMLPQLLMIAGVVIAVAGWWLDSWITIGMGAVLAGYPWWALREASSELSMMEQRIQTAASEIDNYMEQRVIILENLVRLLDQSVALDKEVMLEVTKYRSGAINDENRSEIDGRLNALSSDIRVAVENYPELKSQSAIRDAIQQNSYLQKEITAARSFYNDTVNAWNREIFSFPFKKVVAAQEGKTTRIPFVASKEVKTRSREVFFG